MNRRVPVFHITTNRHCALLESEHYRKVTIRFAAVPRFNRQKDTKLHDVTHACRIRGTRLRQKNSQDTRKKKRVGGSVIASYGMFDMPNDAVRFNFKKSMARHDC
jgi:hypothetical protein